MNPIQYLAAIPWFGADRRQRPRSAHRVSASATLSLFTRRVCSGHRFGRGRSRQHRARSAGGLGRGVGGESGRGQRTWHGVPVGARLRRRPGQCGSGGARGLGRRAGGWLCRHSERDRNRRAALCRWRGVGLLAQRVGPSPASQRTPHSLNRIAHEALFYKRRTVRRLANAGVAGDGPGVEPHGLCRTLLRQPTAGRTGHRTRHGAGTTHLRRAGRGTRSQRRTGGGAGPRRAGLVQVQGALFAPGLGVQNHGRPLAGVTQAQRMRHSGGRYLPARLGRVLSGRPLAP